MVFCEQIVGLCSRQKINNHIIRAQKCATLPCHVMHVPTNKSCASARFFFCLGLSAIVLFKKTDSHFPVEARKTFRKLFSMKQFEKLGEIKNVLFCNKKKLSAFAVSFNSSFSPQRNKLFPSIMRRNKKTTTTTKRNVSIFFRTSFPSTPFTHQNDSRATCYFIFHRRNCVISGFFLSHRN